MAFAQIVGRSSCALAYFHRWRLVDCVRRHWNGSFGNICGALLEVVLQWRVGNILTVKCAFLVVWKAAVKINEWKLTLNTKLVVLKLSLNCKAFEYVLNLSCILHALVHLLFPLCTAFRYDITVNAQWQCPRSANEGLIYSHCKEMIHRVKMLMNRCLWSIWPCSHYYGWLLLMTHKHG